MLVTKNISYSLQQQFLTRDISMQIPQGTFFTIAGPNGSGKSTLLKQLTGALHPTTGNIFLEGKALSSWKKCALAKTRGVLSQYTQTAFPMSVLEMVMLGRYAAGNAERRTQQQDIAEWALDVVRMSAFATRNIQTLSGGEQQRVHLARVLAQIYHPESLEGKYVFLDEPTSSLDIAQQYHVLKVLHQLSAERGLTVGVILHYRSYVLHALFCAEYTKAPALQFSYPDALKSFRFESLPPLYPMPPPGSPLFLPLSLAHILLCRDRWFQ